MLFPCSLAVFAEPKLLALEGFSLPARQFRMTADCAGMPTVTAVAPVDALEAIQSQTCIVVVAFGFAFRESGRRGKCKMIRACLAI